MQRHGHPSPLPLSEYRGLGPPLGPEAAGVRLDRLLARYFPFKSRDTWKLVCQAGHVLVNGRQVRASHRLSCGDRMAVWHPLSAEPEVDDGLELLAESCGVMAVYKPGNLPMHEAGSFRRRTMAALLAERFGAEWHPVHRLDRETSGVVICAADPKLRHHLSVAFERHQVDKRYLAIVQGTAGWEQLSIDQPIIQDPTSARPRYLVRADGAPSSTDLRVLARAPNATLLEARPRSGRTNQIRVHLAWCGHPLQGDKLYHLNPDVYPAYHRYGDVPRVRQLAGFDRHALHAAHIGLTHPTTRRLFCVEAPLPPDLGGLWASLFERQVADTAFAAGGAEQDAQVGLVAPL